jgi:methionyl-tRNA synthetase
MSKSLGNFIDLPTIERYVDEFSLDAFRWYLITQGPLGSTDTDFAREKFIEVYNNDLANTIGNSISRVVNMIWRYFEGNVPGEEAGVETGDGGGFDWPAIAAQTARAVRGHMERFEPGPACAEALSMVRQVDAFIERTRPFALAKDESRRRELSAVLFRCHEALRIASILLWAAMPQKMEDAWAALGVAVDPAGIDFAAATVWRSAPDPGARVVKGEALFPRYVEKAVEA